MIEMNGNGKMLKILHWLQQLHPQEVVVAPSH
jgi:hypothetical protein